jgi:hypothetical protein
VNRSDSKAQLNADVQAFNAVRPAYEKALEDRAQTEETCSSSAVVTVPTQQQALNDMTEVSAWVSARNNTTANRNAVSTLTNAINTHPDPTTTTTLDVVANYYYAQHDYYLDAPDDDASNDDAYYCAFECPGLWACGACVL